MATFFSKYFINFLPFVFVFIASLYQPQDSDLGWHLKYGEYFYQNGEILRTNIYSTQMQGFAWANTGWLSDILTYIIFIVGGFFGLTILGAVIVTLIFWVFSKAYDLSFYEQAIIFPFLIILEAPLNEISFRGQLISILLLGVLIYLLKKAERKSQIFLVPLLFAFWINIHGQFILGLGILILYSGFKFATDFTFTNKRLNLISVKNSFSKNKFYIFLILLSSAATLINPFGSNIYKTAISHFGNKDLQYIMEYLPFDNLSQPWWNQMIFGIFAFLGLIYLFFSDELKKNIPNIGVMTILYGLSWWVRRYAWSMYYLGIPLLKPLAHFIKPDSEKTAQFAGAFLFIFYIASSLYLKYPFSQFTTMNWDIYCAAYTNCSPKAVEFIRDNNLGDNLLSLYGWGGYMIWNYPEVKPSIDGRMHLWKDDWGYSAFSEYYALEQGWKDVQDSKYETVLMWKDKPIYDRLNELVEEGLWSKPYEDDLAGVFTRNK